jgi:hypothetical protein
MVRLCSFALESGHRCRCAATRTQDFCRHHSPEALALRKSSEPAEPSGSPAFSPRREWGQLRIYIAESDATAFPDLLELIMHAAADGAMTPRTAGKLLVLLYRRRMEFQQHALRARSRQLKGPSQVMSFPSPDSKGPESENANL